MVPNLDLKKKKKNGERKALSIYFFKDVQMANRYIKRCLKSLTIREMQTKTTMKYQLMFVRMAVIRKTKVLVRMWRKGNTCTLLVGMEVGSITIENGTNVSQKLKM